MATHTLTDEEMCLYKDLLGEFNFNPTAEGFSRLLKCLRAHGDAAPKRTEGEFLTSSYHPGAAMPESAKARQMLGGLFSYLANKMGDEEAASYFTAALLDEREFNGRFNETPKDDDRVDSFKYFCETLNPPVAKEPLDDGEESQRLYLDVFDAGGKEMLLKMFAVLDESYKMKGSRSCNFPYLREHERRNGAKQSWRERDVEVYLKNILGSHVAFTVYESRANDDITYTAVEMGRSEPYSVRVTGVAQDVMMGIEGATTQATVYASAAWLGARIESSLVEQGRGHLLRQNRVSPKHMNEIVFMKSRDMGMVDLIAHSVKEIGEAAMRGRRIADLVPSLGVEDESYQRIVREPLGWSDEATKSVQFSTYVKAADGVENKAARDYIERLGREEEVFVASMSQRIFDRYNEAENLILAGNPIGAAVKAMEMVDQAANLLRKPNEERKPAVDLSDFEFDKVYAFAETVAQVAMECAKAAGVDDE